MDPRAIASASARRLPGLLQEFADVIGLDAALRIARAVGGIRVYIPERVDHNHWLSHAIGRELADKLCANFGGGALEVPIGPEGERATRERRHAEMILEMTLQGLSSTVIAQRLRLSDRTVRTHRSLLRAAGKLPPAKPGRPRLYPR
jgi:DNA-binding NarL/FixJ family response regulator